MNIIFGDAVKNVPDSYTVLELDTFKLINAGQTFTAWCVIDSISLEDFPVLDRYRDLHKNLLDSYRSQDWPTCYQLIDELSGKWKGVLDSFYQDLAARIRVLEKLPPPPDWDGSVLRDDA